MHFNAAKSMVMQLGTKNIAHICRVGGCHDVERDMGILLKASHVYECFSIVGVNVALEYTCRGRIVVSVLHTDEIAA